ncbi:MAG TPA: GAF domain-containing protein [Chthoniobacterales bacterium]|nr:GAF domain-containing protein [Chthoniobacterales bacterium]
MKRHRSATQKPEIRSTANPVASVRRRTGQAIPKPLDKLEVQVQKRTAELSQANKALREGAARFSAIIATQYDIATAACNFTDVMTLIAKRTQKLTRAKGAAIELIERDELVYRVGTGMASRHVGLRLAIASSLSGECMRLHETLRCDDTESDPRVNREACRKIGLRSMVVVPLYHRGGPVGVLKVLSTEPAAFSESDARALQLMAGLIGVAMSNAAEFESRQALLAERTSTVAALEARARQQNAIAQLSQRALEGLDLPALLGDAVELILQILQVEYCSVIELLSDGNGLLLRAGAGWKEGRVGQIRFSAGRESPAGFALFSNSAVVIEDFATEIRFRQPKFLLDHGVVSAATVIIHGRCKPYGVLGAYTIKRRKFTSDDIHFIQSVANVLAAVIDRRQLEEELLAISGREQQRIGQDLHDGLCQQLVGIEFRNSVLVQQLANEDAKTEATMIGELIRNATRQARLLAKGLSPVQLDAAGLMSALHELTSNASKLFDVSCRFDCPEPVLVADNTVATHLYRIVQEAISNAVKHGQAKLIIVSLTCVADQLTLRIWNNGAEFPSGATGKGGLGLRIMQYRAEMIGATLKFASATDNDATVECTFKIN